MTQVQLTEARILLTLDKESTIKSQITKTLFDVCGTAQSGAHYNHLNCRCKYLLQHY